MSISLQEYILSNVSLCQTIFNTLKKFKYYTKLQKKMLKHAKLIANRFVFLFTILMCCFFTRDGPGRQNFKNIFRKEPRKNKMERVVGRIRYRVDRKVHGKSYGQRTYHDNYYNNNNTH